MTRDAPAIDRVEVRGYRIPTDGSEADGTLHWDATEMLVVSLRAGKQWGLGYSYTAATPATALVQDKLAPVVEGANTFDLPRLWQAMNDALRNTGRPGLGLMAISAVDHALWDLKARLLDIALVDLWGAARDSVPAYGSGGFLTYSDDQLTGQLSGWVGQGFTAVKMKIGRGPAEDARRVAIARHTIGPDVELMVDANGAYRAREAIELIERLAEYDVRWLEEPVSSDDLEGLARLRHRAPGTMAIAAGEYGWDTLYFRRMLEAGAVDVLQADATRCGTTGFLATARVCGDHQVPLSAHCAPALHTALGASVPGFRHVEYFHDHVRIEQRFFDGLPRLHEGRLWPDSSRPGHGLILKESDAAPYRL